MTHLRIALCVLGVTGTLGCKGKPTHEEPAVAETASAAPPRPQFSAEDIKLPPSSGTPPIKTTKPVDKTELDKLSALKFAGFELQPFNNGKRIVQRHLSDSQLKLQAIVLIEACNNDCDTMDLAKWKDKPSLKEHLDEVLQQAKDTVFEVGATDLAGAPMIYSYQLGQAVDPGRGGKYSDMYVLYYNDGINKATVMAAYVDDPMASKEDMARAAPKASLERMAKAFMDAYTHAWAS